MISWVELVANGLSTDLWMRFLAWASVPRSSCSSRDKKKVFLLKKFSLPCEVLRQALACMEPVDLSELLCTQSSWRNLILDPSKWRGQIVDLSCIQLDTHPKKTFAKRFAHAWVHVLRLILAQHQLPVLQPLTEQPFHCFLAGYILRKTLAKVWSVVLEVAIVRSC